MKKELTLKELGESKMIEIIKQLIFQKTGETIKNDDSFFLDLKRNNGLNQNCVVLNTDMLISSSDVPQQMSAYQIGRKSIIMNISDIFVKGISPIAAIISLGLPHKVFKNFFMELMMGIIDTCYSFNMKYLGGDINESTEEIIINPSVIGFGQKNKILYRKGMKVGDIVCVNGNFGVTGVGFNIILKKIGDISDIKYKKAIDAILNPTISTIEGKILAENGLANSSIDSSDGLAKTLKDLSYANSNLGFEINLDDFPTEDFVKEYSEKYNIPLEKLIFNGGEEFIHLFTIDPNNFNKAKKIVQDQNGYLVPIGKVIEDNNIYIKKDDTKEILKEYGYEHFLTPYEKKEN
jgi:thiamine-monophosphate kinase